MSIHFIPNQPIVNYFSQGKWSFIEAFCKSSPQSLKTALTEGFECAAHAGNLEVVQYLLTSPYLPLHADIHHNADYALGVACHKGYMDMVKYLLTSPELSEHSHVRAQQGLALVAAAGGNQTDMAKYLITSPELKLHADVNDGGPYGDNAFMAACKANAPEVARVLASRPEFDASLVFEAMSQDHRNAFMLACIHSGEILQMMLLHMNYTPNTIDQAFMLQNPDMPGIVQTQKILSLRDLNATLHYNLNSEVMHVSPRKKI